MGLMMRFLLVANACVGLSAGLSSLLLQGCPQGFTMTGSETNTVGTACGGVKVRTIECRCDNYPCTHNEKKKLCMLSDFHTRTEMECTTASELSQATASVKAAHDEFMKKLATAGTTVSNKCPEPRPANANTAIKQLKWPATPQCHTDAFMDNKVKIKFQNILDAQMNELQWATNAHRSSANERAFLARQ
jgi:hypothetical protein